MKKELAIMTLFLVGIGLAACSNEPREMTMHEPGVYKGAIDPLLAQKEHQELINRFKLVQTDR